MLCSCSPEKISFTVTLCWTWKRGMSEREKELWRKSHFTTSWLRWNNFGIQEKRTLRDLKLLNEQHIEVCLCMRRLESQTCQFLSSLLPLFFYSTRYTFPLWVGFHIENFSLFFNIVESFFFNFLLHQKKKRRESTSCRRRPEANGQSVFDWLRI